MIRILSISSASRLNAESNDQFERRKFQDFVLFIKNWTNISRKREP